MTSQSVRGNTHRCQRRYHCDQRGSLAPPAHLGDTATLLFVVVRQLALSLILFRVVDVRAVPLSLNLLTCVEKCMCVRGVVHVLKGARDVLARVRQDVLRTARMLIQHK
ncbi:cytochrome b5-like heme/steroid binding domain containing protein, putative [Leishmania tarentolae]|uniref:Cytochrome b5-like heme/steroid binding domain containing protein, putative n=1 Tax=Leishmania tarentolae TaxID=5689 RepID=A0A640KUA2_LEITA|nr:cytochrome b5-like heme/steroid binding domain containing protein, putative [Leishmania tarentolae]